MRIDVYKKEKKIKKKKFNRKWKKQIRCNIKNTRKYKKYRGVE